jgi:hypothetical protein
MVMKPLLKWVIVLLLLSQVQWGDGAQVYGERTAYARVTTPSKINPKSPTRTRTALRTATKTRTKTRTVTRTIAKTHTKTRTATKNPPKMPSLTPTNTPSATVSPTATLTPTPTPNPDAARNTIVNGGFESASGWDTNEVVFTMGTGDVTPKSGMYMMKTQGTTALLYQRATIPASAPYLRFSYRVTDVRMSCGSYFNYISASTTHGISYLDIEACNTAGWVTGTIDMTSDIGLETFFVIEVVTTADGGTVYIDDVGFVSGPTREVDYY